MKLVLKIGGSVLLQDANKIDYIQALAAKLKTWKANHELAIVTGGGAISRNLDQAARALTSDEAALDLIGIQASRVSAALLIAALGADACTAIPRNEEEFLDLIEKKTEKIIVAGGFRPGQRTDAVAAQIASVWNAELLVKGTNVDFAYDKDPSKFEDAKPLENISYEELGKIAEQEHAKANLSTIMDATAAKLLAEKKIKLAIVNAEDLENIEKILSGVEFKGTCVGF